VDTESRQGPPRTVQSGKISPTAMKRGIILIILLAFISGISLLVYSLDLNRINFWIFFLIGSLAILAALYYTMGKRPYGYTGFGDLFVMIFFGFVGVLGAYYLHAGELSWSQIFPALSMGCFATAVLNVNNIRDIESDRHAGKMSIPVRLGRKKAIMYHWILLGSGCLSGCLYTIIEYQSLWQWIFLIVIPFLFITGIGVAKNSDPEKLDPYLKYTALSALFFAIVFGLGLVI
jgi:1,4-dihydroxy-2-naphthoate octaprenyltransferase